MNLKFGARLAILPVLTCLLPAPAPAQEVGEVLVERVEFFTQCTPNRADTTLDRGHGLQAIVFPFSSGSVLGCAVTRPGGSSVTLSNSGSAYGVNLLLPAAAAAGTYSFSIDTLSKSGQKLKVALPGVAKGILPPHVANFPETQVVDASQDFTLLWEKLPKLNPHDQVLFYVVDTNDTTIFYSPDMDIATTNLGIPAGTLQPNTTYSAYLCLRHYSGLQVRHTPYLVASELKGTRFKLRTLNPAGVFQFAAAPVLAREADGVASVTVERTQGSAANATVDYYCEDGSAHSNVNYVAVSGTLDFPAGVTSQTISVPLLNDSVATRPRTFRLTLTNATGGAGLVVRPHTTVTSLDAESAPGTNVNAYLLGKVRFYVQSSTNQPSQSNMCMVARCYASIHPKFPGAVTNAWLQWPKGAPVAMTNSGGAMAFEVNFPSVAAMTKAFAGGSCKFSFETLTDGTFAPKLTLGAERMFVVPHVSNWAELQSADPAGPITLQWDAFQGATDSDCVQVSIEDPAEEYVLQTPAEFEAGVLPGSTRSFTIPAGKLDYGKAYWVNLIFSKVNEGKQVYPGLRNGMVSAHTTSFYLQTIPSPTAGAAAQVKRAAVACPCAEW